MVLSVPALAVLGAALDVLPTDSTLRDSVWGPPNTNPPLLVIDAKVITNTASVRLYRWNPAHKRWIPSQSTAVAIAMDPAVDGGLVEIRATSACLDGPWVLAKTVGTGTVTCTFNIGRS